MGLYLFQGNFLVAGAAGNFVPEPLLRFLKNFGKKDMDGVPGGLGLSTESLRILYLDKKLAGVGIICRR